jgi:hypothetical protein
MAIDRLSTVTEIGASDMLAIFSRAGGLDAQVAVGVLSEFLQSLQPDGGEVAQYASPQGSGFAAQVVDADDGDDIFYLITPSGAFAAGSLILPGNPWNGQRVNVHCSQAVTSFSVSGTGVHGAPTTLSAAGFFTMRWDAVTNGWWRVA